MDELNGSFTSEDLSARDHKEIIQETKNLIGTIDVLKMALESTHDPIESYIKALFSSLSSLVAYEGTFIQQNEELVKYQKEFLNEFNVEGITSKKTQQIEATQGFMPEGIEELNLISRSEEKDDDNPRCHAEGIHNVPYLFKDVASLSENQSALSQINSDDSAKNSKEGKSEYERDKLVDLNHHMLKTYSEPLELPSNAPRDSINNFLNSGKPVNQSGKASPVKKRNASFDNSQDFSPHKRSKAASMVVNDSTQEARPFKLVEFKDVKSDIIAEEKERFEHSSDKSEGEEKNRTTFDKRFGLEKGEKLIDSFSCAVAMKILLQGRLYITNQRLCFHSFFNNKFVIFGKDTKLTIPLNHIISLEKRVNAIFFDNSIAVITKDEKETFFTSFLLRDKAFEVIKMLLEKDGKPNKHNPNMLKRTFIRSKSPEKAKENNEGESEEEEEEDDDNPFIEVNPASLSEEGRSGEELKMEAREPSEAQPPAEGQPAINIKAEEVQKKLNDIELANAQKINYVDDELDPDSNEDYEERCEFTLDNMTLPCFYNRIFGTRPHPSYENKIFWQVFLEKKKDYNIEVSANYHYYL